MLFFYALSCSFWNFKIAPFYGNTFLRRLKCVVISAFKKLQFDLKFTAEALFALVIETTVSAFLDIIIFLFLIRKLKNTLKIMQIIFELFLRL